MKISNASGINIARLPVTPVCVCVCVCISISQDKVKLLLSGIRVKKKMKTCKEGMHTPDKVKLLLFGMYACQRPPFPPARCLLAARACLLREAPI